MYFVTTGVLDLNRENQFQQRAAEFGISPTWYTPTRHNFLLGQGVKIGVIDSGVPSHSFITKRVTKSRSFIPHVGVEDSLGHARLVMGRIVSFAPDAELYVAKVAQSQNGINRTSVLQAMEWLADSGVNVINLSLGFPHKGPNGEPMSGPCMGTCVFCLNVVALAQEGIALVAAAGNGGPQTGSIACPAGASDIISVGAVDDHGRLLSSSSRGTDVHRKPDLLAPGVVHSLGQGTSYAAPVVTGLLAAAMSRYTKTDAVSALRDACRNLGLKAHEMGAGLVDPKQYVEVLKSVHLSSADRDQRGLGTN